MKLNLEEEILIKDKANTTPGIAYPMPARFVISFNNKPLFGRLAKDNTKENIIVINAVIRPRLIVLNDMVSNSIDKPCWS